MRLENLIDLRHNTLVLGVVVGQSHGDVVDGEADEGLGFAVVGVSADVHGAGGHGDEVDDHVEGWEADAGVDGCDVAGEGLLGGRVLES